VLHLRKAVQKTLNQYWGNTMQIKREVLEKFSKGQIEIKGRKPECITFRCGPFKFHYEEAVPTVYIYPEWLVQKCSEGWDDVPVFALSFDLNLFSEEYSDDKMLRIRGKGRRESVVSFFSSDHSELLQKA
jgi:hypothetical protein